MFVWKFFWYCNSHKIEPYSFNLLQIKNQPGSNQTFHLLFYFNGRVKRSSWWFDFNHTDLKYLKFPYFFPVLHVRSKYVHRICTNLHHDLPTSCNMSRLNDRKVPLHCVHPSGKWFHDRVLHVFFTPSWKKITWNR